MGHMEAKIPSSDEISASLLSTRMRIKIREPLYNGALCKIHFLMSQYEFLFVEYDRSLTTGSLCFLIDGGVYVLAKARMICSLPVTS